MARHFRNVAAAVLFLTLFAAPGTTAPRTDCPTVFFCNDMNYRFDMCLGLSGCSSQYSHCSSYCEHPPEMWECTEGTNWVSVECWCYDNCIPD